ncbi:MAG: hypothetical protein HOZ81_34110 [Streptomyces sp.]|nr:hypothetical protein [Streptomyces sp.]NUS07469.1 hypothetical protein [Nonomuraea sp.]NUT25850.1 hypothetical protein [Streptomyces sp.]
MRSTLRATRRRAVSGALAFLALFAVAAGALGDIGWPSPASGSDVVRARDIGWPAPAPSQPLLAGASDDIGWPAPLQ